METVSNNIRKVVRSLSEAKYRRVESAFVAEGTKCVLDVLPAFGLRMIIATAAWYDEHREIAARYGERCLQATRADMERMSSLTTPQPVLAVLDIPEYRLDVGQLQGQLIVALDRVGDPGNLGTILRICDWMGVRDILAGEDSVSVYNPKAVQASMGSIARVRVHRVSLPALLADIRDAGMPVFGTFLDGDNLYNLDLPRCGVIVMGNEGQGISREVAATVTNRLFIPPYPGDAPHPESLNVAVATALTLAQFRHGQRHAGS